MLEIGPGLIPGLQELNRNDELPETYKIFIQSVLDAFQDAYGDSQGPHSADLPELLTPRELDILRLIGKGYSNPEIASQLVVSLNTVKKHTSNIYGKLGVRSRTQAIARAQQLNLI